MLVGLADLTDARLRAEQAGYDVLGANRELAGAEVELVELEGRDAPEAGAGADRVRIRLHLDRLSTVVVAADVNGLCAAHGVIIPMQCEYLALEGLADLVNTIKRVAAHLNPDLTIIGLLRVMFDPRMTLQQQASEQLVAKFGDKVFSTIIPRNVRLAEAPSYGMPGVAYDRTSKGAQAYVAFGAEMIDRIRAL